jgi:hypothetical protein
MTLATLRSPLIIQPSPARSRVAAAAAELQRAIDQLFEEAKEQARERARRAEESDAKARAHIARAQARQATRGLRIEIDRKMFWSLTGDLVETLRQCAVDARQRGATGDACVIERVIDGACEQLERIQKKEASR